MKTPSIRWALTLLLAAGCQGANNEVTDEGRVCLTGAAENAPLTVEVTRDDCISACVENEVETCTLTQRGDLLELSSTFSYDDGPEEEACIALCNAQQATCSTDDALAAGSYTLVHGDDSYDVNVPTADLPSCL